MLIISTTFIGLFCTETDGCNILDCCTKPNLTENNKKSEKVANDVDGLYKQPQLNTIQNCTNNKLNFQLEKLKQSSKELSLTETYLTMIGIIKLKPILKYALFFLTFQVKFIFLNNLFILNFLVFFKVKKKFNKKSIIFYHNVFF